MQGIDESFLLSGFVQVIFRDFEAPSFLALIVKQRLDSRVELLVLLLVRLRAAHLLRQILAVVVEFSDCSEVAQLGVNPGLLEILIIIKSGLSAYGLGHLFNYF